MRKILVVDDDKSFHKDIRNAPDFQGHFEFEEALDADAAIRYLDGGAPFDLVLLDLLLDQGSSEKTGLNLIPAIKGRYPSVPIIVVTNEYNIGTAVHAIKNGASDYLFKGEYNPTKWNRTIRETLGEDADTDGEMLNIKKNIRIFISYSHRQKIYFEAFKNDFKDYAVLPGYKVDMTTDCEIPLGAKWDDFLQSRVQDCHVMLLLVSQSFMNSEYIQVKEFGAALKRLKRGDNMKIVPVYFAPCFFYHNNDLAELQFFKPHGDQFGNWQKGDKFSYIDLVNFNHANGQPIPNSNREHYMVELMNRLGPELITLAARL